MRFRFNAVTVGYFELLRMRLARGRVFASTDTDGAPLVAIVSQAMVDRLWPETSGVGERFTTIAAARDGGEPGREFEVVGVLAGAATPGLDEEDDTAAIWVAFAQNYAANVVVHVRGASALLELRLIPSPSFSKPKVSS